MSADRARTEGPRRRWGAAVAAAGVALSLLPVGVAGAAVPGGEVLFPTDELTVADASQITGKRIALPKPDCTELPSRCHEIDLINQFDGFDLEPRITLQLGTAPGDVDAEMTADVLYVEPVAGGDRIGLNRFVLDPDTLLLYGQPREFLQESTTYRVVYEAPAGRSETTFTTMSAPRGLAQMRAQLDDGSAYDAAGIPADERGIEFVREDGTRTVFQVPDVLEMTRYDQRTTDCDDLTSESILNSARAGAALYGFGSFRSPSWLDADQTIPQTPTETGAPAVQGEETVGVTVIVPAGPKPAEGWPTAIFGPGVTRSKYDLWLAADTNAARGLATIAIDPVGHAYGECSEVGVNLLSQGGAEVRFSGFGRAFDQDGDGIITDQEGLAAPVQPHPKASVGARDGLRQTAADVMALARAVERGVDVDGDGTVDLRPDRVGLYAQSLGGIYSTQVMGVDPEIQVAALNVPGGPILNIVTISPVFRDIVTQALGDRQPCLLNGGPNGFTADVPLYLDPAVTEPVSGAIAIQEVSARVNWLNRPGSPETFAPLLRSRPLPEVGQPKDIIYQFALGDETVPNPTSATIMRAGDLQDRTSFYRNDLTATRDTNPHGFLLDPRVQGRSQGQQQVVDFLTSDGATITDPDAAAPTWEVPIADPDLLEVRNFADATYAEPTPAPAGCAANAGEAAPPVEPSDEPAPTDSATPLPATGGGATLLGLSLMGLGATVARRRHA